MITADTKARLVIALTSEKAGNEVANLLNSIPSGAQAASGLALPKSLFQAGITTTDIQKIVYYNTVTETIDIYTLDGSGDSSYTAIGSILDVTTSTIILNVGLYDWALADGAISNGTDVRVVDTGLVSAGGLSRQDIVYGTAVTTTLSGSVSPIFIKRTVF